MANYISAIAIVFGVAISAHAQQAYKYVDENGKVTYSQTPPASVKSDPRPVNIAPANQSRQERSDPALFVGEYGADVPHDSRPTRREKRDKDLEFAKRLEKNRAKQQ
jgi:hypothetical protein